MSVFLGFSICGIVGGGQLLSIRFPEQDGPAFGTKRRQKKVQPAIFCQDCRLNTNRRSVLFFDVYVQLREGNLDALGGQTLLDGFQQIEINRPIVLFFCPDSDRIIKRAFVLL